MRKHNFQIKSIEACEVKYLFSLDQEALHLLGAKRITVDEKPGYPCRVSLQDAEIGEEVLLFPYRHHDVTSPYQSSGPIFVREGGVTAEIAHNTVPLMLRHRLLSVRAYDFAGMMLTAKTIRGEKLEDTIEEILENASIKYLHIHNADPGCYNCCVERFTHRLHD